jgi:predicted RNA binding protein YcfA (HicA-like mRNA interferase family)
MKSVSGKALCRVLEKHGWALLRTTGSHHVYGRQGSPIRLSVPVHANATLKRGLLAYFLKAAGLTESDL